MELASVRIKILLYILLTLCVSCTSPVITSVTTIRTIDHVISASDKATATWYTQKANMCYSQAIDTRDGHLKARETMDRAIEAGKNVYVECIATPNLVALKIADAVELLYRENRVAAQTVVDVINKRAPLAILGTISTKAMDMIIELRRLLTENHINIGED